MLFQFIEQETYSIIFTAFHQINMANTSKDMCLLAIKLIVDRYFGLVQVLNQYVAVFSCNVTTSFYIFGFKSCITITILVFIFGI